MIKVDNGQRLISGCRIKNKGFGIRATKEFRVSGSLNESGPWRILLEDELADTRNKYYPDLVNFTFEQPVEIQFLQFELISYWGDDGGALQYFAAIHVRSKLYFISAEENHYLLLLSLKYQNVVALFSSQRWFRAPAIPAPTQLVVSSSWVRTTHIWAMASTTTGWQNIKRQQDRDLQSSWTSARGELSAFSSRTRGRDSTPFGQQRSSMCPVPWTRMVLGSLWFKAS